MTKPSKTASSYQNAARQSKRVNAIIILVTLAAFVYLFVRDAYPINPVEFARVHDPASDFKRTPAGWTWIERPANQKAQLVRGTIGDPNVVKIADAIAGYDTDGKRTAWIAKDGNEWSIQVEGMSAPVFRGSSQPKGVCISGDRIFWTLQTAATVPGNVPAPTLGQKLVVISQSLSAGAPSIVTELLESDGVPLGTRGSDLFVQAFRPGTPGSMAIYRMPVTGGQAERIIGESERYPALLAKDGTLFWQAESMNASNPISVSCIRRLRPNGKIETLIDWVPAGGRLFETDRGVIYNHSGYQRSAWPVEFSSNGFPPSLRLPSNYAVLALANTEALAIPIPATRGSSMLYRIDLK